MVTLTYFLEIMNKFLEANGIQKVLPPNMTTSVDQQTNTTPKRSPSPSPSPSPMPYSGVVSPNVSPQPISSSFSLSLPPTQFTPNIASHVNLPPLTHLTTLLPPLSPIPNTQTQAIPFPSPQPSNSENIPVLHISDNSSSSSLDLDVDESSSLSSPPSPLPTNELDRSTYLLRSHQTPLLPTPSLSSTPTTVPSTPLPQRKS